MIGPKEVPQSHIDLAKEFIRQPLTDGFRAWHTLRDRDNVTMTIAELAHLMAWWAKIWEDKIKEQVSVDTRELEVKLLLLKGLMQDDNKALPERTDAH